MVEEFWNPEIETRPLQKLKELQLKRLKKIVHYIYENNKFYNQKLKYAQVKPEDIKTLNDIKRPPFLTKQDLRNYYSFGSICTEFDDVVEVHASYLVQQVNQWLDRILKIMLNSGEK